MFSNWLEYRTCPCSGVNTCTVAEAWKKWGRWCQLWGALVDAGKPLQKQLIPRTRLFVKSTESLCLSPTDLVWDAGWDGRKQSSSGAWHSR